MTEFYVKRGVDDGLVKEVADGSWVEVVGPQRIGKTMMGQRLVTAAKGQGRLAGYCDMDRAFRYSSDEALPQEVANVLAAALGLEAPHVPKPSTPPPVSGADVEESAEKPELLSSRLKKVLAALAEQSVDGSPMLLVLDELGKLRAAFRDAFVSTFVALDPAQCQLVVLGNEEAQDYSAAFGKKLKTLWPPDFSRAQALDAVSFELNDAPSTEPSWDDAETERKVSDGIYEWVGGHAQLTRYWARKARAQGKAAYADETRTSTLAGLVAAEAGSRLFVRAAAWLEGWRAVDEIDAQLVYWQLLHDDPVGYDEGLRSHRHLRQAGFAAVGGDLSLRLRSRMFGKALNAEWVKTRLRKRALPEVLLEGERLLTWLRHGRESTGLPSHAAGKRVIEWAGQTSSPALLRVEAIRGFVDACHGRQRRRKLLGIGLPLMVVLVGLGWLVVQAAIDKQRLEETQIVASQLHDRAQELMQFAQSFRDEESNDAKRQFFKNAEDVTRKLLREIAGTDTGIDNVLRALGEDPAELVVEHPQRFIVAEGLAHEAVSDRDQAQELRTVAETVLAGLQAELSERIRERDIARQVVLNVFVALGEQRSTRQERFSRAASLARRTHGDLATARGVIHDVLVVLEHDDPSAGDAVQLAAQTLSERNDAREAVGRVLSAFHDNDSGTDRERFTRAVRLARNSQQERDDAHNAVEQVLTALTAETSGSFVVRLTRAESLVVSKLQELSSCQANLDTCQPRLTTRTTERDAAHSTLAICTTDRTACQASHSSCPAALGSCLTTCQTNLRTCASVLTTCQATLASCLTRCQTALATCLPS